MAIIYGLLSACPWLLAAADKAKDSTQKVSGFSAYGMWILIVVMILVFYFLLIRPQRKRAQEHEAMVTKIQRGDEVVTIGGIHGVIRKMTEDTVVLEVDKGVRITFSRSAISKSLTQPEEEEEEEEEEEPVEEEQAEEEQAEEEEAPAGGENKGGGERE